MARGPTAYFIFCGEHRAEARAYVEAAAEPGQKISVATVAKRLGELWKAQSEEEKQRYKDLVVERAKAAAEAEAVPASPTSSAGGSAEGAAAAGGEAGEAADGPAEEGEEGGNAAAGAEGEGEEGDDVGEEKRAPPMGLPISVVKRIMCFDEDVQRVTSGAVRATARAAELFMQMLAAKALALAKQSKRKNLKFADIERVVRGDRRCVDMCLKDVLCSEPMFAEARGELAAAAEGDGDGEKENEDAETAPRPAKVSKKAATDIAGVRPITSFFKAS